MFSYDLVVSLNWSLSLKVMQLRKFLQPTKLILLGVLFGGLAVGQTIASVSVDRIGQEIESVRMARDGAYAKMRRCQEELRQNQMKDMQDIEEMIRLLRGPMTEQVLQRAISRTPRVLHRTAHPCGEDAYWRDPSFEQRMMKVISDYARQHGISLVVGLTRKPFFAYIAEARDITQEIIDLYRLSFSGNAALSTSR